MIQCSDSGVSSSHSQSSHHFADSFSGASNKGKIGIINNIASGNNFFDVNNTFCSICVLVVLEMFTLTKDNYKLYKKIIICTKKILFYSLGNHIDFKDVSELPLDWSLKTKLSFTSHQVGTAVLSLSLLV